MTHPKPQITKLHLQDVGREDGGRGRLEVTVKDRGGVQGTLVVVKE